MALLQFLLNLHCSLGFLHLCKGQKTNVFLFYLVLGVQISALQFFLSIILGPPQFQLANTLLAIQPRIQGISLMIPGTPLHSPLPSQPCHTNSCHPPHWLWILASVPSAPGDRCAPLCSLPEPQSIMRHQAGAGTIAGPFHFPLLLRITVLCWLLFTV